MYFLSNDTLRNKVLCVLTYLLTVYTALQPSSASIGHVRKITVDFQHVFCMNHSSLKFCLKITDQLKNSYLQCTALEDGCQVLEHRAHTNLLCSVGYIKAKTTNLSNPKFH